MSVKTGIKPTMKMMKTVLISSTILASTPLLAQTGTATGTATSQAQTSAAPYGDNPGIFEVLGHKAQRTLENTVEKVDYGVQRGIAKVKPKVENAWEGTKGFATEKSVIAIEKTQHAAVKVNQKLNETKDGLIGSPNDQPAPIISHPLSESSTDQQ